MKILVVAAHPDDEVLGCGGTINRLSRENEVGIISIADGVSARGAGGSAKRTTQMGLAAKRLGAIRYATYALPDNQLDTVPLLNICKLIEGDIETLQPDIIFTHSAVDLNIDHRIVNQAVLTAARPIGCVKRILGFEVLSSSEWNPPNVFNPTYFVKLTRDNINAKIEAMEIYEDEIRYYPHPRSEHGIETLAQYRGMTAGNEYAEGFEVLRWIY